MHHRQYIAALLPSKRKLEDYAPSFLSPTSLETLTMGPTSFFPNNPNPNKPRLSSSSSSKSAPSSSSSSTSSPPSSSPSSSTVQFFLRADDSRSVLIRAPAESTVLSAISRAVPATSARCYRIVHSGRPLDPDATLAEAGIVSDTTLHLSGRLRSTRLPRSHQLAAAIVDAVIDLARGRGRNLSRELDSLVIDFLASTPSTDDPATAEHVSVLSLTAVPAALAALYIARQHASAAECSIRAFLKHAQEYVPKQAHPQCALVVLEFCRNLSVDDQLYVDCRSSLATLLKSGSPSLESLKDCNLADELYRFIVELSEILIEGIESDTMDICSSTLADFPKFVSATRKGIEMWFGRGQISKGLLCDERHPQFEKWIIKLHSVFVRILMKVDGCLAKLGKLSVDKGGPTCSDSVLGVLTSVWKFSKIYEGADELLHKVLLVRRGSVNTLIRGAKRNVNLKWLLKFKDVIDFEARQSLVMMLFPDGKDDYERMHEMLLDRFKLLEESFEYIGQVEAQALHGGLFVEFKNETATGPGVLREWFTSVCKEIFNPNNVLFMPCPNDRRRFFPNPASTVDPLNLKYFGFCGRVIALALMHKVQIGVVFDRVFFLQLAGKTITLEDIKDADPCLYVSCKQILEMDADLLDSDILGLTFVREFDQLGKKNTAELCYGGKDIIVDSRNRNEYINLLIRHRFVTSTSNQVLHFARGFSDILSNAKLKKHFFLSLDLEDFDRMLGGSECINVSDWKAHTEYNGYKVKDRVIGWFWKAVEGMSEQQRRVLLFFWTSIKYLPVDGFGGLASKLYIYKVPDGSDRLPTSHTCFYRICLPQYPSFSIMKERLQFITQEHVSCSFGMW